MPSPAVGGHFPRAGASAGPLRVPDGDLDAHGPLPWMDIALRSMVGPIVAALVLSGIAAALAARSASQAFAIARGESELLGLNAALSAVGLHPAPLVMWALWLTLAFGAMTIERHARRVVHTAGIVAALGLGFLVFLPATGAVGALGFGRYDEALVGLAGGNLPANAWLFGLAAALGYYGARKHDALITVGSVAVFVFLVWEIGAGRAEAWSAVIANARDALSHSVAAPAMTPAVDAAFLSATRWVQLRAVADLLLLAAPFVIIRSHTLRRLRDYGATSWRTVGRSSG